MTDSDIPSGSLTIGRVIDWDAVTATVHALVATAAPEGMLSLQRFALGLTDPLRRLAMLGDLAQGALAGSDQLAGNLRTALASVVEATPTARGLFRRFIEPEEPQAGAAADCECGGVEPLLPRDQETEPAVLDEAGLVELLLATARLHAGCSTRSRAEAFDALLALVHAGDAFASLHRAHRAGGARQLLARLDELGSSGRFTGFMGVARPVMSGFGGPSVPDFPGFPGFPGTDQVPGGLPGHKPVDELIDAIKNRKRWGPEVWEPVVHLVREPVAYLPSGWLAHLACLREVARRLAARAALPPPARPARVTWNDGIESLTLGGTCAGDALVVHGHGFAALRSMALLLLPFVDGCDPVAVPAAAWTDTTITVTLPVGIVSGAIGFADAAYAAAYSRWVTEQNRLADEIRGFPCYRLAGRLDIAAPFGECPPDRGLNRLHAGAPEIQGFTVNGSTASVVEPGGPGVLAWRVVNADRIELKRITGVGPTFGGSPAVVDPPGTSYNLGPFIADRPQDASYELRATGPCGVVSAKVTLRVRKVPVLQIVGIEVTQAIQTFRTPGVADNSIPLVSLKDTIVRVYVAVENLAGFKPGGVAPDRVAISGEVQVAGILLPPLATAEASPNLQLDRSKTEHTLNFRIPAGLCSGSQNLRIRAWTKDEIATPPLGATTRSVTWPAYHSVHWVDRVPFKVRYVRIGRDGVTLISDAQAREVILRAFDLLATPPTDIAPARLPTWNTSQDWNTRDGISELLDQLDDQHDCSFSEWLLPWEDECPDADGAVWVGVTSRIGWGGLAQGYRAFNTSRNTAIVPPERMVAAHEMGHTLALNHVNVTGSAPFDDDSDFDALPNGGVIGRGDAFDPAAGTTVNGLGGGIVSLYDFMSYATFRWVSPTNRQRVFDKF